MPINLAQTVVGGAQNLCGSFLTSPIYMAVLVTTVIFIILVWSYWSHCKISSHLSTIFYIFISTLILMLAHTEAIKSTYEMRYKDKEAAALVESITDARQQELLTQLYGSERPQPSIQHSDSSMQQSAPQAPRV
jgi:hypothetical protein